MDVNTNLFPCAHCSETGTCRTGDNNNTCSACLRAHNIKGKNHVGLICGVCFGLGSAEPPTEKILRRYQPASNIYALCVCLGLLAVTLAMYVIFEKESLKYIMTLLTIIITGILGIKGISHLFSKKDQSI